MRLFSEERELVQYAKKFIGERLDSLEECVAKCLSEPKPYATFPALLYCFATIDLLGALYSGNARKRNAPTSNQSLEYMEKFMGYTTEQSNLLQKQFRHKLVHLAQPKAVIKYNGQLISWHYWHESAENHLEIKKFPEKQIISVTPCLNIECDYEFNISIVHFAEDIRKSVEQPNGYLASLERSQGLQVNFERALSHIYDYEQ